jgi:glyoxylase-like metal-dependent hydrolase (beta-lactamase superfamily II)
MGKQVRLAAMVRGRYFSEQPAIRRVSSILMLVLLACAGNASEARDAALQGASAPFAVLDEAWLSPNDCDAIRDPIRIETLDEVTFIFRESPCVDREAPFLFLLIGTERALLVDSGTQDGVFLVEVVGQKLAENGLGFADLTVAHSHSHLDHRSGDGALADAGARVVGPTVEEVREFWNLEAWPEGVASLDLGDRLVEVLPIPGHNDNSVALFDHGTRALLSGDSMIRGKINVNDLSAFRDSVARLSRFIDDVDPRVILGGHLERANVPLGLAPATVEELAVLSERVSFVRPFARGDHFTIVYLRPIFAAMGGGFLLLIGGLLRRLVLAARRRRTRNGQ